MKSLDGQVILITGAAGGMGQSLVKLLLPLGARLALADMDAATLEERTRLTLKDAGHERLLDGIIGYFGADLAVFGGPETLMAAVTARAPHIDILINNAGISLSGHFFDVPRAEWERLIQIDLLAPMRLIALTLPAMIARKHGHIANVASIAGVVGTSYLAPYSAAKFGLAGFSEALYKDLRPLGVDVTVVYPIFTRTPMLQAPHYGPPVDDSETPGWMLAEPDFVMAQFIRGIRRRQLHVYPGVVPRAVYFVRRYVPGGWRLLPQS